MVARRAHNPEAGGSSPPPATNEEKSKDFSSFFYVHISTAILSPADSQSSTVTSNEIGYLVVSASSGVVFCFVVSILGTRMESTRLFAGGRSMISILAHPNVDPIASITVQMIGNAIVFMSKSV